MHYSVILIKKIPEAGELLILYSSQEQKPHTKRLTV